MMTNIYGNIVSIRSFLGSQIQNFAQYIENSVFAIDFAQKES